MNPIEIFKKASKTQTLKDTGIVFLGQAVFTLISVFFFILIARILGPEKLGIYSTVTALVLIVTDTVDVAVNSSIIKFINKEDNKSFLKFAFLLKFLMGIFFLLLIFFGRGLISAVLQRDLNEPLKVAAFLIFAIFIYRFPKAIFQAQKKFINDALMDVFFGISRLALLILLIYLARLTVVNVFYTQVFSVLLVALLGFKLISLNFLQADISQRVRQKFFSFQGWLTLGFILAAVHSRIDNFFLIRFAGPSMVGFYQAGYRFFLPVLQFASVLSTVFAPRFTSFHNQVQVKNYLKKSAMLSGSLAFLILLSIFFLPSLIRIFYGERYSLAALPTQILAVGYAFFIFAVPFNSCLIYKLEKTKFFAFLNLFQLILIVSLDFILIPRFSVNGAALATTITLLIINSLAVFWVIKK